MHGPLPQYQRTQVNMFQECHIQRRADRVCLLGIKHNLAAIIALLERRENIVCIVLSVAIVDYMARLGPRPAGWKRLERLVWFARVCSGISLAIGDAMRVCATSALDGKSK